MQAPATPGMSTTTAIWWIAAAVLLVAVVAVIVWRVRYTRQLRSHGAGNLARKCSNCGRSLTAGATACPSCGTDMTMLIT